MTVDRIVLARVAFVIALVVSCHEPEPRRPNVPVEHFALSFTSDGLSFGRHDMKYTQDDYQADTSCRRGDDPAGRRIEISVAYHADAVLTVTAANVDVSFPWSHVVLARSTCATFDFAEKRVAGGMVSGVIHLSCTATGTDNRLVFDAEYLCPR
jgi:hypothetical protein